MKNSCQHIFPSSLSVDFLMTYFLCNREYCLYLLICNTVTVNTGHSPPTKPLIFHLFCALCDTFHRIQFNLIQRTPSLPPSFSVFLLLSHLPSDESHSSFALHGDGQGVRVALNRTVYIRPSNHLNRKHRDSNNIIISIIKIQRADHSYQ
jgi:hypothetical protein